MPERDSVENLTPTEIQEPVTLVWLHKSNGISRERLIREVNQSGIDIHVKDGRVSPTDANLILGLIDKLREEGRISPKKE